MYPVLETDRITLRPFTEDDAENVFNLVRIFDEQSDNPQFTKIRTIEDAKKLNNETVKADNEWIIIYKETQTPIGWVLCNGADILRKAFIHAWIQTEYQHKGLGREILEKVLHFAFFGIKTETVLANARNYEKLAYQLLSNYGFKIYNYVPKNKPNDNGTLVQFSLSKENYINQKHIVESTYDYEPPKKRESPYNYDNPVRKIEFINYVKEPTGYLCGQSVIAMLADVPVDEVIDVMHTDKGTSIPMIRDALEYYGIKTVTKTRKKYTEETALPDCSILSVQLPGYGHWSLYYKGKFYDPEFGVLDKLPLKAKLCYYWEVQI